MSACCRSWASRRRDARARPRSAGCWPGLDGDVLNAVLGAWMRARVGLLGGRRVIAIDGKTVRGAKAGGHLAPHLVAALDHRLGAVLGQVQVAAKSNEIPALRTLLEAFDLQRHRFWRRAPTGHRRSRDLEPLAMRASVPMGP